MKRKLVIVAILMSLCLGFCLSADAASSRYGNFVYEVQSDGTAQITDFYNFDSAVTIPDKFGKYTVTSIKSRAFEDCSNITSITLPSTLKFIGSSAFSGCYRLQKVYAPSLEAWMNIHFDGVNSTPMIWASELYIGGNILTEVVIPNEITEISRYAFYKCTTLKNVTFHDGITAIGENAFSGCSALQSIDLPNSVLTIGDKAFNECRNIKTFTLPDKLIAIGASAFYGCGGLNDVVLPDTVTSIGSAAFMASKLKSICLPDALTIIEDDLFNGTALNKITLPSQLSSIGHRAFSNCSVLNEVILPDTVTFIGERAFAYCTSITNFVMPDSVTQIGDSLFYGCENLVSAVMSDNLTSIGESIFTYCNKLSSVTLPSRLGGISPWAFNRCTALKTITIPQGVLAIGENAFLDCTALQSITFPDSLTAIEKRAFYTCESLSSIVLPDSLVTVGDEAFAWCKELKYVMIPGQTKPAYQLNSIPSAFSVYCYEYSEADFWAERLGYPRIYLDNLTGLIEFTLRADQTSLQVGEKLSITPVLFPAQSNPSIIWSSSAPEVAAVENGVVSALSAGQTTITAVCGSKSASVTITVYAYVEDFSLSQEDIWMVSKDVIQLDVEKIIPVGSKYNFSLLNSNSSAITISASADRTAMNITGKSIGETTLSVTETLSGIVRECKIHVCYPVTAIAFDNENLCLLPGATTQLTANVTARDQTIVNKLVTFSSSNETVATVNADGVVTAHAAGTAMITAASANGVSANCMITVTAVSALTYEEAYNQAADSGKVEDYQVFEAPEKDRAVTGLFDEISAEWTYDGDELFITIDMDKTDWDSVIVKKYFPGSGAVYISPGFESPTGESTPHRSMGISFDGINTEKYVIELLRREYEQHGTNTGPSCVNGIEIGRYDEDSGLFQPMETERHGLVCAWGEDGELVFNYMAVTIRYTHTEPITVRIPKVPASDIHALYDMPEADREQIVLTISNGNISAVADAAGSLSQSWGGIAVTVPEEAGDEAWSCIRLDNWGGEWECPMLSPEETGLDRRSAQISSFDFYEDQFAREDNFVLEWCDETGAVRGYAQIYLSQSTGNPQPWPYYVANWTPVPASRMQLDKNRFPEGIDAVYDESGVLTLTIDHDTLPETANFGRANYAVYVDPPASTIATAGMAQSTANNIYGASQANGFKNDAFSHTRDRTWPVSQNRSMVGGDIFQTYHQQGSDVTVYMTSEMTGPFAGRVVLMSWWEDGADPSVDDPYLTEYIVVLQESCVRVLRSTPLDSEDALPEVVTQPVIIIPQGSLKNPNSSMEFTAMIYPQQGSKARYYKLELVDEDGNPVDLEKGQYKVFLPFPEGISEEEKQNLELIHMTDAHVEIENLSINGGTLHLTDAGVWFQAKSFSPFVLRWGEASAPQYPICQCENGHEMTYEMAFDGAGFMQSCDCNEASVEFIGPVQDEYAYGDYIELIISWSREDGWWQGEEPQVWYAPISGSEYGEWTTDMPTESGEYAVKMMYGSMETCEYTFTIAEKVTECENGHTLQYALLDDGFTLSETCTGEGCHAASVEFAGPAKDAFEYEEEISLTIHYEGDWLGADPKVFYKSAGSDEWSTYMPWDSGEYSVHLAFEALTTNDHTFVINERVPSVVCEEGHSLYYVVDGRPNSPTNGIRELCEGSCHMAYVEIYAPFDTPEGEFLDYVCSWDGYWMGEYPEVMFASVDGETYGEWSPLTPSEPGSYAMKLVLGELETDCQTFAILESEGSDAVLTLPATLTRIESEAFAGTDVAYVVCPNGMTEIGSRAFADCENLAVIEIPASVETIAQDAFDGCSGFTIVGEEGSAAQQFAIDAGLTFEAK